MNIFEEQRFKVNCTSQEGVKVGAMILLINLPGGSSREWRGNAGSEL